MVGKSDAERKRAERERKTAEGLVRYEVWLRPNEFIAVWQYIKQIRESLSISQKAAKARKAKRSKK